MGVRESDTAALRTRHLAGTWPVCQASPGAVNVYWTSASNHYRSFGISAAGGARADNTIWEMTPVSASRAVVVKMFHRRESGQSRSPLALLSKCQGSSFRGWEFRLNAGLVRGLDTSVETRCTLSLSVFEGGHVRKLRKRQL